MRIRSALLGLFLSFMFGISQGWSTTFTFGYTGSIVDWVVPEAGVYQITAIGAQGGHGTVYNDYVGGLGAKIGGDFSLTAGETLHLAVGGQGTSIEDDYNGGGGGGSFVVIGGTPILIAGGGGGIRAYAEQNGFDASVTPYGIQGTGSNPSGTAITKTTDLGQGGQNGTSSWGSGGAGFYSDGQNDDTYGTGGKSWANGLLGGTSTYTTGCVGNGGFGGGGAGAGCGGGGGGGGYSGGDGGWIAGGGGSYNTGLNPFAIAGFGYGDGSIIIEKETSAVPEPTSLILLGTGLGVLGLAAWRKNK